jgi:hypothetical protein
MVLSPVSISFRRARLSCYGVLSANKCPVIALENDPHDPNVFVARKQKACGHLFSGRIVKNSSALPASQKFTIVE